MSFIHIFVFFHFLHLAILLISQNIRKQITRGHSIYFKLCNGKLAFKEIEILILSKNSFPNTSSNFLVFIFLFFLVGKVKWKYGKR